MLKTIRLHNFRTYLNAELTFTERHLIIGRNNTGKSNLYAALRFLGATATGDLPRAALAIPGGSWEIKNWAFDSEIVELSCTCELSFDGDRLKYSYALSLAIEATAPLGSSLGGDPVLRVKHEQLSIHGGGFADTVLLENDGHEAHMLHEEGFLRHDPRERVTTLAPADATMLSKLYELDTNRRAVLFRRYLSSWNFFMLNPEQMRFGWREAQATPVGLNPGGNNLAVVLYHLKNYDERRYRRIIEHVRLIEPDLEAINFLPTAGQIPVPFVELRRRPQASWTGLSDGTLRCLALAFLAEVARPYDDRLSDKIAQLIFIEEPENGIFPGQLRTFFDLFEDRAGGGQFIFTTHSPYFINFFDARRDSVTILRRNNERTIVITPPGPDENDPDRPLLAEQYSMELFD